ncbi:MULTISPECIES: PadR family transcriptional regulator [Microbacterium]|uniref:PadR family transcriptional regulator n=1 Tax=Microbacterium profundi TaxID=450380 RepID=A0ABV3LGQ9_9MICO|nr:MULTISPECIES: PadR family transcriptional regulator [Microbacterium]MCE7481471.1 PadR family transcriptional regulator [Microbacterium profundi]
MQLRHAILGLLDIAPQSGYDLGRAFAGSVAHFWHADQSQIYRTIDRLETDGAVATELIVQTGRPDRRVHELTDAGRAELRAWLHSPVEAPLPKEPFLARLFFAESLGVEGVLALLDERADAVRAEREQLAEIPRATQGLGAVLRTATLDAGLRAAEAELSWLADVRISVKKEMP